MNNPIQNFETSIKTVQTLWNLNSEFVEVKQTGNIFDQLTISGIVEKYLLTNQNRSFSPDKIIHFNDINTSGVGTSIMGTSKLHILKMPITNTELAFSAMNVLLKSRGMQGIISIDKKDATGTTLPLNKEEKDQIDKTFKKKYGIQEDQNQFLISYNNVKFQKTIMSSEELGIYNELTNNAMIICNAFDVPSELYKTYKEGQTFENQAVAERRLYNNAVIPLVDNDDKYWTNRLKLRNYGFELRTDWSHIPSLAEAEKDKAAALSLNVRSADMAYNNDVITLNQYLAMIGLEAIGSEGDKKKSEFKPAVAPIVEPVN